MNNERRKEIEKAMDLLYNASEIIRIIREEEDKCFDNMPQSFQDGAKGEKSQNAIGLLESAEDYIDSALDDIQAAKQ